ncbi:MAG: two-component system, sensor histidine kinase LadS [Bryobacterales bacterium]|jgi:diguanylate cyclase (GGDEF)-like protein|nr:two-component system, sensor histidine kinase LadS [Bryobacterales bacterium]
MWLTKSALKSADFPSQSRWLSRRLAASLIVPALFGIFMLDRATETAPVQHLYYLPIIYAAVVFDRRGGLGAAAVAIALYHLANHPNLAKPYSELDVVQMALFVTVAIVAARLNSDSRRLQMLATTDDLTGLHNLRSFEARLVRMVGGARRTKLPLAMLALDVDHLKLINDAHGHLAGAGAVRTVGQLLAAHLPAKAVACRYGGDEFAIAIPYCTVSAARDIGDTLCRAVHASRPVLAGHSMPQGTLSISVGIADLLPAGRSKFLNDGISEEAAAETLFRAADKALYLAKANGRNRAYSA